MSSRLKLAGICLAAAFALAACGGGGGSTTADRDADTAETQDPTPGQRMDISDAIDTASAAVAAVNNDSSDGDVSAANAAIAAARDAITAATNVPAAERAANTETVDALAGRLTAAVTARQVAMDAADEADRKAINAMAKKLRAGLGVAAGDALVVSSISVSGGKLTGTVDPDGTNGSETGTVTTLDSSGAVTPAIAGWNGADYRKTTSGVTNHAVVYSNPGPPLRQRFEVKHANIIEDANGAVLQTSFGDFKIAGSAFASGSGTKTHSLPAGSTADYLSERGTFDGAPGQFRCARTATCTSSVDATTGVSLSAGWYFIADDGAMTSTPDPDYLMFGWWARDTGMSVGVDTFTATVGTVAISGGVNALEGEATYVGGASGKVAVYSPLSDNNDAGAFNAKATLTAKFGDGTAAGNISGMLSGFSVEGRAKDWSVELKETAIGDGASTYGGASARTAWTIGGEKAADAGAWEGTLYEAAPATSDIAGTPLSTTGTFSAEYGTVGRMKGAFGASRKKE